MEQRLFRAIHKDNDVWNKSSSGGAFTAITDAWFAEHEDASVYGCVMDGAKRAVHVRATDTAMRDRMRGSKYIGSDMSGVFRQISADLNAGMWVLFSGTPCQVAGLYSYLDAISCERTRLLTVEVICHGVGSVKFFEDYITHLEKKYKSKAINAKFRAKSRPGKLQDMHVKFENGRQYTASSTKYDWFYSTYHTNLILRPSCYNCKFAKRERVADICIADQWGEDFSGKNRSRSLFIVSSERGLSLCERAFSDMEYTEITWDDVHQLHVKEPSKIPANHEGFWNAYRSGGYLAAQAYIGNNTPKGKLKSFIVDLVYILHIKEIVTILKRKLRKRK